jgi:hypothetical protein
MRAMGVNSLDRVHPLERYLREAAVFPLYEAGDIGMQMRKIWGVMLDKDFDPRAIADSRPMPFKRSMEGAGTDSPAANITSAVSSDSNVPSRTTPNSPPRQRRANQ